MQPQGGIHNKRTGDAGDQYLTRAEFHGTIRLTSNNLREQSLSLWRALSIASPNTDEFSATDKGDL